MTQLDPGPHGGLPRPRILLVEDDAAACKGLARLLQAHGFAVTVVSNGTLALAALAAGPPPDFVLTDLQLPDLDGREIARFSVTLQPAPRVGIITGWDLHLSPRECRESGIDWIMAKPLHVQELLELLRSTPCSSPLADEGKVL